MEKVLILCTGNSCRSHIAEGILRHLASDLFEVYSAGSEPTGYVHPLAIRSLKEIGIDLIQPRSKHLSEFVELEIDTVITVCDGAKSSCPVFPGKQRLYHWAFADPSLAQGGVEEQYVVFESARDQIYQVFQAYVQGHREGIGKS